jgi:Zn-dependent M28 family amino/carboxypeptidase
VATRPTAFLSREDDARLKDGQEAQLTVRGAWVPSRDGNVVATIPGRTREKLVVGAHFDSVWRSHGAIDNATGVEGLLRIARRFAAQRLPRTLELVAFAAEEIGLVGSRRYIFEARERGRLGEIVGMVNLDCIGRGEKLNVLCWPASLGELAKSSADRLGLSRRYELVTEIGGDVGTDHLPFAEVGIPALSILHFPYEEYHLPEESPLLIDERRLSDAVNFAADLIELQLSAPI